MDEFVYYDPILDEIFVVETPFMALRYAPESIWFTLFLGVL